MTAPAAPPTSRIGIDHHSAVHLAAVTARAVAADCGLPGAMPDQAAVVASELAGNLRKHAVDGVLYVQPLPLGGGMEITAVDGGPGMADPELALTDGYTTTGTLGAGLGAVDRIATSLTLRSRAGRGTLVCARLAPPDRPDAAFQQAGVVRLPAEAEDTCGDAHALADDGTARTAVVVDGLGHGPEAAFAARAAVRAFGRAPDRPLPELLTTVHRALRHTRGAAVGLLRLFPDHADYCGVGNVRAVVLSPQEMGRRTSGQPGVVGMRIPEPQVRSLPLAPGGTAVLYTDGIGPGWTETPPPFLLRLPPSLLVAAVAHRHRRVRDDATVLAARPAAAA